MAKSQTRRSISISRTTYDRVKAYCDQNNLSLSHFVEVRIAEALGYQAPPLRKTLKTTRWARPEAPVEPTPPGLPTAAEIKKSLEPPPAPIRKKPEVKLDPPKSTLPPSKIFTF